MRNRLLGRAAPIRAATMRVTWALGLACVRMLAQTGEPAPAFDVASIKRQPAGMPYSGGLKRLITPTSLTLHNATLGNCIEAAFGYEHFAVIGPAWRDRPTDVVYEIDARTSTPASEKQMLRMLQKLLADRLGLQFHRETRDLPVYALVVAKGGPKFQKSAGEGELSIKSAGEQAMRYEHISMARFAQMLDPPFTSRHTIDETGLAGVYDFTFHSEPYYPIDPETGKLKVDGRGALDMESMYIRALPAELGLRLEKKTAPMEVMIIDRVEKDPTAN